MTGPILAKGLRSRHWTGEIISRPYIDLTLQVMKETGADAEWTGRTYLEGKLHSPYHPTPYYVESDWSAASYWYEIVALSKL